VTKKLLRKLSMETEEGITIHLGWQNLRALVTVGHHAVLRAVETLMGEFNQDVSRIDRKSKGALEVW